MSPLMRRAALSARLRTSPLSRPGLRRTYADSAAAPSKKKSVLQQGARRDPELYILLSIMVGAFGLAGWHFGSNPTSSSSLNKVVQAVDSEPWKTGTDAKYQYHPGGDASRRKDAPSALNEVVIPHVTLPKSLHEQFNKWGKDGY